VCFLLATAQVELKVDEWEPLLFGNERTGLENHHMRAVHATALISTGRQKSSLNLSHAVGISLHEQHAALVGLGLDTTFHSQYFAKKTRFNRPILIYHYRLGEMPYRVADKASALRAGMRAAG